MVGTGIDDNADEATGQELLSLDDSMREPISNQVQEGRPLQFTADGLSLLTGGAPIDIAPIVQKIPNTSAINPPTIRPIAPAVESVTLRRNIDLSMHK